VGHHGQPAAVLCNKREHREQEVTEMDEVAAGKHAKPAAMSLLHEQLEHQASHQSNDGLGPAC
jgi:hypothetical protein